MALSIKQKLSKYLFEPVSPVGLGVFRIGFGLIMAYQFFHVYEYFFDYLSYSKYFIKYDFFEWVVLPDKPLLFALFVIGVVASLFFAVGFLYRISSFVVFVIWTYLYLTDMGHNNNHYYLIGMFLFFLPFVQANKWGGLFNKESENIPRWNYTVFQLLIFILYFYGALAKMNSDWLNGYPLHFWLSGRYQWGDTIGDLLSNEKTVLFFSYYGLLFDLFVGFMLFHRKLKYLALILMLPFHIMNHFLWVIGVFPWLSIFMTVLFFNDELTHLFKYDVKSHRNYKSQVSHNLILYALSLFFLIQFLFPLRQFFYSGRTSWHGYGEYFSWRMMLTDRQGAVRVRLYDQNDRYLGDVALEKYINDRQLYKFIHIPKTFVPFCKSIEKQILEDPRNTQIKDVKIYVDVFKTINNREFQRLINPDIDLTAVEYSVFRKGEYILPFKETPIKQSYSTLSEEEIKRFIRE